MVAIRKSQTGIGRAETTQCFGFFCAGFVGEEQFGRLVCLMGGKGSCQLWEISAEFKGELRVLFGILLFVSAREIPPTADCFSGIGNGREKEEY